MKFSFVVVIIFLSLAAAAQTPVANKPEDLFQFSGSFHSYDGGGEVYGYDLMEDNRRLRVLRESVIHFVDLEKNSANVIVQHENADAATANLFTRDGGVSRKRFLGVSADKSKFLSGSFRAKEKQPKDAEFFIVPAKVFDAHNGKWIKNLDATKLPVESGLWSRNNRILLTTSAEFYPFNYQTSALYETRGNGDFHSGALGTTEITLWDGDTLDKRATIEINNLTFGFLSPDGEKLVTASGAARDLVGIDYVSDKAVTLQIWNTGNGKLEKEFVLGDENHFFLASKLKIFPDGKFAALVLKNRKSRADDKLVILDLTETTPKLVINPAQTITDSVVSYSPDGALVAVEAEKNSLVYNTRTGELVSTLNNFKVPDFWFDENRIALRDHYGRLTAVEIKTGKVVLDEHAGALYREYYVGWADPFDGNNDNDYDHQLFSPQVIPHPDGKTFLFFSNQALKIYDATTGKVVQTLIEAPPIRKRKNKIFGISFGKETIVNTTKFIEYAGFTDDFKKIYVVGARYSNVLLWKIKE